MLVLSMAFTGTTVAQTATNAPPKPAPVMTEELMARLVIYARGDETNGSVTAKISKVFDLNDGTQDLPLKLGESDIGDHFIGVPLQLDSKDILILVGHYPSGETPNKSWRVIEAYLTDKTCKLRAAAVLENGVARLITNEKAAEKFKAELALFAKEADEQLPPTKTIPANK